ncbi:DNA internalization-related competence protein ComEC/Rec2 [Streptococcus caballi]|uniref:DNA internalization-related competence protein ComEC/Rec2 n=1 Tax=Streptococcus caballi TaxID=439220 RepID=UPI0003659162|nr:DNA internalization-related competence protein ComEC/Rec2 [Streptococcus caballi]
MIRYLPIKPIHLAFLLVLLYFLVFSWTIAGLVLMILAFLFLCRHYGRTQVTKTLCFLAGFGLYFAVLNYQHQQHQQNQPASLQQLKVIPDSIAINGDLLSFRGQSNGQTYQAFYRLQSQAEQRFFRDLDKTIQLDLVAKTEVPTPQRNFSGFNYQAYLKTQGIYRLAKIEKIKSVHLAKPAGITGYLQEWRRKAIVSIQTNFPTPMRHYMTGLLFGHLDKSFGEMSDLYSSLGIIHLFALSGMQVGFFLGIFRYLFLRMGWCRGYVDFLQIPFSICYAGLTGFSISVIRSLLQSSLANLGFKQLDNLALTIIFSFFIMPNFLLTTGGILSFAYAFILSLTDFDDLSKYRKIIAETLTISLGILPILIYYFSTFQPMSIVLTAVFSLAFDLIMLPMLSIIFLLSPLVKITFANSFFSLLESLVSWAGKIFSRPLVFGKPDILLLLASLILLGCLYDFYRRKRLALLLSLVIALLFFLSKHPLQNEVTVVDVGQGDSIFLRDVRGKTVLIDVGGKVAFENKQEWQKRDMDSNAERTLIPYLNSRGVSRIDQLVLTHTDTDHIGDMEEVAKHFDIGEVLVSPGSLTVPNFVERLKVMRTKVRVVKAGDSLPIMGSHLQVLYPNQTGDGGNNDSLVLYGKLLDKTFLFTGDLEEAGEAELLASYPPFSIDVLKAGHHGSKGSSSPEFLAQLQPKIALISAGQNNRYKHPHQETLDRLKKINSQVYRTDQQGAIRFIGLKKWMTETVR